MIQWFTIQTWLEDLPSSSNWAKQQERHRVQNMENLFPEADGAEESSLPPHASGLPWQVQVNYKFSLLYAQLTLGKWPRQSGQSCSQESCGASPKQTLHLLKLGSVFLPKNCHKILTIETVAMDGVVLRDIGLPQDLIAITLSLATISSLVNVPDM